MEFTRRSFKKLFFQIGFFKHDETDVSQPGASDFLTLCKGTIAKLDKLVKPIKRPQESSEESDYQLLNKHQCLWLVRRLSDTRESTLAEIQQPSLDEKGSQVLRELHHVLLDVDRLIQSCCIKSTASDLEWLRKIIEQGDMRETFSKLFFDVKWHADVLQRIVDSDFEDSSNFTEADCTGDLSVENREALRIAKKKDDKFLISRLESLKLDYPLEQELSDQLLERMNLSVDKHQKSSVSVGHLLLLDPEKLKNHLGGRSLGKGSFGEVQETDVLGGSFAVKFFDEKPTVEKKDSAFEKEKDAIQGLGHHPHVVRLYCYSKMDDRCYLIMEKMDEDLARILQHRRRNGNKLSLVEKVVLMLKIAEGIRYIHSKHMAHRDLKPGNVLVNLEDPSNRSSRACSVKIADFGLTKTRNARYMAPEVIAIQSEGHPARTELNPRKADAYSFGIMCYEILTGKTFGVECNLCELKKHVKYSAFRPDLQKESGPLSLKSLIQQCWDNNFRSRPDFKEICQALRYIKGLLLEDDQQKLQTDIKFTSIKESSEESDYQLLNKHQCLWLVRRVLHTRETVLAEIQQPSLDERSSQVLKELHHVLLDVDKLIQSCCIKSTASDLEWLRKIIEQGDMKETFSKLFFDVKWHADVLQRIVDPDYEEFGSFTEADCTGDLSEENGKALWIAKNKDDRILIGCLKSLKLDDPLEQELADRLLEKMSADKHEKSSVSVGHLLLLDPKKLKNHLGGRSLGKGSFGEVQETDVLGGSFAMKLFHEKSNVEKKDSVFEKEKDAIQGLGHHPHVVRLYCYSKLDDRCYLIMEKMDEDLAQILQHRKYEGIELSLLEKIVLMLEIAEGIRYIHSKHMAHRDLKPGNVLVNLEDPSNSSSRACSVKIADFGLTKTKNASRTYTDQTTNTGTARYMAPEVISIRSEGHPARTELNLRKADAYSFGIMCYEILTGKTFGVEYNLCELKKHVKYSAFRPDLQKESGPLSLKSLIQQCWDNNFRSRPDFKEICQALRYIKGLLLEGDQSLTSIIFFNITNSYTNCYSTLF